ncbi:hypothetical protein RvY_11906 [Ramazzottius varieornatus]|uniref:Reverse transcriptase domain-containing protein n=1 Tax=Ramazzottius varieornatus TaxID=947166 RepID=A0A1D1VQC8_RAMVA|nr:hypothetical protein RvY_11906 [Ramazzottius varieornatus]
MAKADVQSAFRLIPARKEDWNLLEYFFDIEYCFDIVLPFGLRSSPATSNRLPQFVKWLLIHNGPTVDWVHYMDDFFVVCDSEQKCHQAMLYMKQLCEDLGVPLADEKDRGSFKQLNFSRSGD